MREPKIIERSYWNYLEPVSKLLVLSKGRNKK